MTNVPQGPIFYILFDVIPAFFVSLVGAGLFKVIERGKNRNQHIVVSIILTIVSLAVVSFLHADTFPANVVFGFIGILWFLLAVIIAVLCFLKPPYGNERPFFALLITFIVYNTEMALFYIGRWAGLRDATVWIFPPVPMTYELMLWPVWFHAVVQFFLTLLLSCILILILRNYLVTREPQQHRTL